VHVVIAGCGELICGTVVWASSAAISDAREGGTPNLIGTRLLRDYRMTGEGRWQGRVFVPDWNRDFFSRLETVNGSTLKVSGCVFGGYICKSQLWTRV